MEIQPITRDALRRRLAEAEKNLTPGMDPEHPEMRRVDMLRRALDAADRSWDEVTRDIEAWRRCEG